MPELPEITVISKQMNRQLKDKRIAEAQIKQSKILNMPINEFVKASKGKTVKQVSSKGKWIFMKLEPHYFMLINLGMGAELLYFKPDQKLPDKIQFKLTFSDGTGFTIHFWWFGYVHLVPDKELAKHKPTSALGLPPTEDGFTLSYFKNLLSDKKTRIKGFLLDQKNVAGIGNVYVQDILFKAKLHPNRKVSDLSDHDIEALYESMREVLNASIKAGGLAYEVDFFGRKGGFGMERFLVGYKTGKPCPECKMPIEKIRTGSTASYICPNCQSMG